MPKLPASPQQPATRVTVAPARAQQPLVGLPAEDRRVVAVRLGDDLDAGEVGRRSSRSAVEQLGEGQHAGGDLDRPRVVGELDGVAAQRGQADGSRPTTGTPLATYGAQRRDRARR